MNKSQREIRNLNRKAKKKNTGEVFSTRTEFNTHGKKHTVHIEKMDHSATAFLEPQQAIDEMKRVGKRSWKINKKHPANQRVKGSEE